MLSVSVIRNKVSHAVSKIRRRCHCECEIFVLLESAICDGEYAHLVDGRYCYAFVLEVNAKIAPYMLRQVEYLNAWLAEYNRKHNTKFVCLGIEAVMD